MTRHRYGISALVTQTSFCEVSSGKWQVYLQSFGRRSIPYMAVHENSLLPFILEKLIYQMRKKNNWLFVYNMKRKEWS